MTSKQWQWASKMGSLYVSGKLPTYPSLKPTFCPKLEVPVSVNVGLGDGYVGSFPEMYDDPQNVRAACPKDKLDLFVFFNPRYIP